jgi:hypothetical protein
MMQGISPRFITDLIYQINEELSNKEKNTRRYEYTEIFFTEWQKAYKKETGQNFEMLNNSDSNGNEWFDSTKTLQNMEHELLFKIAVDLGIEIPGLIYSVATITGITQPTRQSFEKACKEVYENPAHAVIQANSALESLIKDICTDERIANCKQNDTQQKLLVHILKEFKISQTPKLNENIRDITSGFQTASAAIQNLRDFHTKAHGAATAEKRDIISDPLAAAFIVNACATIGLFLQGYYEKNYPKLPVEVTDDIDDDIPF